MGGRGDFIIKTPQVPQVQSVSAIPYPDLYKHRGHNFNIMTAKIAREKLSLAQCLKPSCETAMYHGKLFCATVALCYNAANQLSLARQ